MTKFENYKRPCCISFHVKTRRWIRSFIQYGPQTALLAALITLLMIWLGALAQDARTAASKDTKYLYETTRVCGLHVYNLTSITPTSSVAPLSTASTTSPIPTAAATTATTTTTTTTGNFSMLTSNATSSPLPSNSSTIAPASSGSVNGDEEEQQLAGEDNGIGNSSSSTSFPLMTFETFDSKEDAMMRSEHQQKQQLLLEESLSNETTSTSSNDIGTSIVAHCGDCGACSNPHDIKIYDDTKDTLFESSFVCSKRGLFGGRRVARRCLRERIGFTDECNDCWVENIMCDVRDCLFTCMWHALFSEVNSNADPTNLDHQQTLNRCTECDEKRCGPAFVKCAGANRRRSGILSEFERDVENEFCSAVDTGWWNDETIQSYWSSQSEQLQKQLEGQQRQEMEGADESVLDEKSSGEGDERRSLRLRTTPLNEG